MKVLKFHIRGISLKKLFYLFMVVFSVLIIFFIHESYISSVEAEFYHIHVEEYLLQEEKNASTVPQKSHGCLLPDYNPFDPSILQYIRPWPKIYCGQMQPYLTYIDDDGFIQQNTTGIRESGIPSADLQCAYQEIERCSKSDDCIHLHPPIIFQTSEMVLSDFVVVKCHQLPYSRLVYETAHAHVPSLSSKGLKPRVISDKKNQRNHPSVFILVLDSMSRLNFINQLPKTYKFLTDILKVYIFKGLTKTGDNTYPNMMPMIAGMGAYAHIYADDLLPGEKLWIPIWGGHDSRHQNFDDVPFVWKNFSSAGYVTMFAEDLPEFSIFNYLAKGFFNPPSDYYMRPFWLAIDKIKNFKSSDSRCYGNTPQHIYLFNYIEEFVRKISNVSYFAFSFLTALSHDHINSVKVVDNDIVTMLKRIWSSGGFDNSIVIVMGDHGNRFDDIRSTVIGRVEERMPFFSLSLPESLHKTHPHLHRGLIANRDTLMSWFDIYELLMDIALDNIGEVSRVPRWGVVGLSPLRPLPKNRTCREIGIPRTYCVCGNEKEMNPQDSHAVEAAEALLSHVNNLLKMSGAGEKCAELKLKKVLNGQLLLPSVPIISPSGLVLETRIAIETSPGGAQLEAILERDAWSENGGNVIGEVNRINKYGNQSFCVEDLVMKLYCFCKSLLISSSVAPHF